MSKTAQGLTWNFVERYIFNRFAAAAGPSRAFRNCSRPSLEQGLMHCARQVTRCDLTKKRVFKMRWMTMPAVCMHYIAPPSMSVASCVLLASTIHQSLLCRPQ